MERYGDHVRTAPLDVADETAAYAAMQVAVDAFGSLGVIVDNAGYDDIAPLEQTGGPQALSDLRTALAV